MFRFKKVVSLVLVICLMGAMFLNAAAVSASAAGTYSTGQYIISEKLGLNIRIGPGTGYKKIGAVSYNTVVEVVAVNGDWGKISSSYGGKTGWICLKYATKKTAENAYSTGLYTIREKVGVNIRIGPGTGYKKIGAVSYNAVVEVVAVNGDWGKISSSYGGKTGWICLKYATKQSEENGSATRVMPDSSLYSLTGVAYTIDGAVYRQAKLKKDLGSSTSTSAGTLFWLDMENYIVTDPGTLDKLMDLLLINEIRPNLVSILEGLQSAATGYYDVFSAWTRIGSFGGVMGTSLGVAVGVAATGGIKLADVGIEVLGTVADPENVAASAYLAMIRLYSSNVINCGTEGLRALENTITSYDEAEYAMNMYALVAANQAALEHLAGEQVRDIANSNWFDFPAHYFKEVVMGFAGAVIPDIPVAQMAWYITNGSASLLDFGMSTGVLEVYEDAFGESGRYLGNTYPKLHQAAEDLIDAVMNQNPYVAYGLQDKVSELMDIYEPGSRKNYFSKARAYQCHGFACEALMLFWNTGKPTPTNNLYTYYKATASKSYVDKIRPGDMVRYRIGNYDHTIVVTNVDDEYVYYADCNADLKCTIEYNKRMSKTELASLLTKKLINQAVSTRGYICHYRYNNL